MSSVNLPDRIEADLAALEADRRSGAMALGHRAALLLRALAESGEDPFRPLLGRVTARLVRAQPSMAPLLHVANHALLAADGPDGAAGVAARMENDVELLDEAGRGYTHQLIREIGLDGTVVTLSHSGQVERALREAGEQVGCCWRVIIAESQPGGEGRALAERIAGSVHEVRLVADAAAPNYLRNATLLVGADALSQRGLINKVGTMGLAGLAHFLGRPVLVLASDFKLVPDPLDPLIALDPRAAETLVDPAPEGVAQDMHLFDVTPLGWLSHIYTELGILKPDALRQHLLEWTVHPSLVEEAERR